MICSSPCACDLNQVSVRCVFFLWFWVVFEYFLVPLFSLGTRQSSFCFAHLDLRARSVKQYHSRPEALSLPSCLHSSTPESPCEFSYLRWAHLTIPSFPRPRPLLTLPRTTRSLDHAEFLSAPAKVRWLAGLSSKLTSWVLSEMDCMSCLDRLGCLS